MSVNVLTRIVANSNSTKGFEEFVRTVSKYPTGIDTTLQNVLGHEAWEELDRSEKIKLGKAVMSNVKNGSLTGLQAIDTPLGKNQIYRVVGKVRWLTIFATEYLVSEKNIETILNLNRNKTELAFVRCTCHNDNNDVVTLNVEAILPSGDAIFKSKPRSMLLGEYEGRKIEQGNFEFKTILTLWYAFDRVFEERELLKQKNIKTVCFLAPNEKMMLREAEGKFDTLNNSFDYTSYIQNSFAQFKKEGLRELPFKHSIISPSNSE
jgi:hypothetical protein